MNNEVEKCHLVRRDQEPGVHFDLPFEGKGGGTQISGETGIYKRVYFPFVDGKNGTLGSVVL